MCMTIHWLVWSVHDNCTWTDWPVMTTTLNKIDWHVHDNYTKTDWPVHDDALPGLVCEWQLHQDCWPVHDDALAGLVCAWHLHLDWLTCAWRSTGLAGLCMTTMPRLTDLCMTMHWLDWLTCAWRCTGWAGRGWPWATRWWSSWRRERSQSSWSSSNMSARIG